MISHYVLRHCCISVSSSKRQIPSFSLS
ncbi:hypothetical protein DVH07_10400 [Hafnia paralvei]|nr:hypothetical protein DU449_13840 [Hafnia paralvei]RDA64965.1 hypothetical protein DVH08_16690 [Hafnia paralvei]RDA65939.1 hypothetical protein DVH09_14395 [Hafnia paralvei]RDA76513.1 hypothetical protein DVH10_14160 [Hafnia paralvei]RDA78691.1 hypothetical protein DVH07_10400 [Hafnia paralvei]